MLANRHLRNRCLLSARPAFSTLLLGVTTGCMTVQPVLAPGPFISGKHPGVVYVLDKDSSLLAIVQPRLQGDSVVGLLPGYSEPVGVALPEVRQVLARQPDHTRSTLLAVGVASVAGLIAYAVLHAKGSSAVCSNPEPPYTTCTN